MGSLGAVVAAYQWYHTGSTLYIYSTSDPDSAYYSIEVAQRQRGIYSNQKDHLRIYDIEGAFTWENIFDCTWVGNDIYLSGLHAHHAGNDGIVMGSITTGGVSTSLVHDCISHGIYIVGMAGYPTSNVVVDKNEVYNCYHTAIDVMNINGSSFSGVTVCHNKLYCTTAYDLTIDQGGLIYTSGAAGYTATYINIYGNLLYDFVGSGIKIGPYSYNINIFNNTIAYTLSTYSSDSTCVHLGWTSAVEDGLVFKNNILVGNANTYRCLLVWDFNAIDACDYNLYYSTSDEVLQQRTSDWKQYDNEDWATWKSDTGLDANSPTPDNPDFTNPSARDLSLTASSPAIDIGENLGDAYDDALDPSSSWPESVSILDQDDSGSGWEIGAYAYEP
jgi:hypothetical protein